MPGKKRVALSWSSGKDSAWALHLLLQSDQVEVAALITTFNHAADRVAMHAVRRELVELQAQRTGLPLWPVELPWPCSNQAYEALVGQLHERAISEGIEAVAYGDLFLRDIREYREKQLSGTGLEPLFPLWDIPTGELAATMLGAGLKAKLTCVDPGKLDRSFAGRDYDAGLLRDLPADVDPCGENGEFHTFVYAAPVFSKPLAVASGEVVERDGFVFADVLTL